MKLPIIDGRECVPVRLLPFLTNWRPLSPDVVARLFSWRDEWRKWSISTYRLSRDRTVLELAPSAWDNIDDELTILARRLKRQEDFEFEKYPKWRRRSLKVLPAGVFVWRDELVADYARTFGRQMFVTLRPGAGGRTEAAAKAELKRIIRISKKPNPSKDDEAEIEKFNRDAEQSVIFRPGDGVLNFASPLLSPEDERMVFDGFDSAPARVTGPEIAPPPASPASAVPESLARPQTQPAAPLFAPARLTDLESAPASPPPAEPAPASAPAGAKAEATSNASERTVLHSTKSRGRRDTLDPVIERAQSKCANPTDTAEVWAQMRVLALDEQPPLLGATAQGLKYMKDTRNGEEVEYFKRDALDKRLHPEKRKARRRAPPTAADRR